MSLSLRGPKPDGLRPRTAQDYKGLSRPPHIDKLEDSTGKKAKVESLSIQVEDSKDGFVTGFIHLPPSFTTRTTQQEHHQTAAILLSGAGGGVNGPSSIYLSLACKLAVVGVGIPTLRLDYRYPARLRYCVDDVKAAMEYLNEMYGLTHFTIVGWSFGGAPVFTIGGEDPRVSGCATVASQTAETDGIKDLAPRPVLLLHGTGDSTLTYRCSERLYSMYGSGGRRVLKLFEGDDHALSKNSQVAEALLFEFIVDCTGLQVAPEEEKTVVNQQLMSEDEKTKLMEKGGDLRAPENLSSDFSEVNNQ
ncbi:hypothetical protein HJFPF1_00181 [Paramyrothecium foliicola]|nr:hypothetical protein HJFPF1_00181 [Paramyrothecium foliicola]